MSHVVTIQTRVHDPAAVAAACARLHLPAPQHGTVEFFNGAATGLLVRLPDWEYPVAIDTLSGSLRYDDYEGRWGNPAHLDQFLQAYAVERAKLEARKKGYACTEQTLADGSIKLQILEGS